MSILKRAKQIGIKRFLKKASFYDEVYAIGIRPKQEWNDDRINTAVPFHLLNESSSYWMADPLLYTYEGKDWLFVELFDKAKHKGTIAVIDPESQNAPQIIIEESYHMSFPMVFEWNNQYYMIPETSEHHSINLYRAIDFPYKWTLEQSFHTDSLLVDSIVLDIDDSSIKLLASEINPENELYVRFVQYKIKPGKDTLEFSIKTPLNTYNLIERNGGYPLQKNKKNYLMTQTSSEIDYGVSVSLSEYVNNVLTYKQTLNKENIIIEQLPKENIIGIHTYSKGNTYEVIDVRYLRLDWLLNVRRLVNHFSK